MTVQKMNYFVNKVNKMKSTKLRAFYSPWAITYTADSQRKNWLIFFYFLHFACVIVVVNAKGESDGDGRSGGGNNDESGGGDDDRSESDGGDEDDTNIMTRIGIYIGL